jgi:hypothetical protein
MNEIGRAAVLTIGPIRPFTTPKMTAMTASPTSPPS